MTETAMNAKWICMLGAVAAALWPALSGAECRAASPNHTVALIELYTSEGCDSCPPADRWLSALDLGPPATRAVALAFHVDYWDRLGWRDRFGSATFTERQYEQMGRRHAAFVYTPQVLLQGAEFSRWGDASQPVATPDRRARRLAMERPRSIYTCASRRFATGPMRQSRSR
jgi:hypothetical protein